MAIERVLMLIADIGGYTRFMNLHRLSLSHAQDVVARLLVAVLEGAGKDYELAKLEGDAVFLYARVPAGKEPDLERFTQKIQQMRRAFATEQAQMAAERMCSCDGCVQAEQLKIKFVAHLGEAAFQRIRSFVELAGVDVILVHRMLKNSVPVSEYVLMTEPVRERLEPTVRGLAKAQEEEFEGLGKHLTHYIDLNEVGPEKIPEFKAGWLKRFSSLVARNARSIPYLVGAREPCAGFGHLHDIEGESPGQPSKEPLGEGVRQ